MSLPETGTTWELALQPSLQPLAVRYWQITDVLICDYLSGFGNPQGVGSPNNWAAASVGLGTKGVFTPFAADGTIREDLLVTSGSGLQAFYHIGELKEDNVEITMDLTVQETPSAQSVRTVRDVLTKLDDKLSFTPIESSPLVDQLRYELPLVNGFDAIGTAGYQLVRPVMDQLVERTIVLLGVDGDGNLRAEVFPRVVTDKKGKVPFQRKTPESLDLSYTALPDPMTQSVMWVCREGTTWRSLGGAPDFTTTPPTATETGTTTATVEFATPTGLDAPFTYTVAQQTGGSGAFTASSLSGLPVVSGANTTLSITGLSASTAYVFQVTATGSNDATATSPNSNSVTTS